MKYNYSDVDYAYSAEALLDKLYENVSEGDCNILCVDRQKRRIYCVHMMIFKDLCEALSDETGRFVFYKEAEETETDTSDDNDGE